MTRFLKLKTAFAGVALFLAASCGERETPAEREAQLRDFYNAISEGHSLSNHPALKNLEADGYYRLYVPAEAAPKQQKLRIMFFKDRENGVIYAGKVEESSNTIGGDFDRFRIDLVREQDVLQDAPIGTIVTSTRKKGDTNTGMKPVTCEILKEENEAKVLECE